MSYWYGRILKLWISNFTENEIKTSNKLPILIYDFISFQELERMKAEVEEEKDRMEILANELKAEYERLKVWVHYTYWSFLSVWSVGLITDRKGR